MLKCSRLLITSFGVLRQTFTLDVGSPRQQVTADSAAVREGIERGQTQGGTISVPSFRAAQAYWVEKYNTQL